MKVIANFRLWEKAVRARSNNDNSSPNCTLKFSAVKDEIFGPYTPSGSIEMTVVQSAADAFELGEQYLLTFEPFPKTEKA